MAGGSNRNEAWQGRVISIQPRIRLTRSFDERSHSDVGYGLRLDGTIGERGGEFLVGIGVAAQAQHRFRADDLVSGESLPVADPRTECVEFYRTTQLAVVARGAEHATAPPPWLGVPPELSGYRARGHRRLDSRTYEAKCCACIWGCRMPVELIVDPWKPWEKRHRFETFCYGPKSCAVYHPGPTRKVPGRRGMTWEEEDWVDEEATAHRAPDE